MGSFGERLRREREMRGVSLDDIAEATKIGTRLLRALEDEQFELLPGGIFNKGFVRAYAKYLGMNEDELVADYLQAAGDSSVDPRLVAEQNDNRIDRLVDAPAAARMAGFPIIPVLILLVVIVAGAAGWRLYQDRVKQRQAREDAAVTQIARVHQNVATSAATNSSTTSDTQSPVTVPDNNLQNSVPQSASATSTTTNPPQAKGPDPAASNGTPSTTNPNESQAAGTKTAISPSGPVAKLANTQQSNEQPFEVSVRAKDKAWVSIRSDGKYAVRGIISPPDIKTVRATDQVIFYTGNAGAVEISFNGQRIALEGGPNSTGTLVFNSHGLIIPRPAVTREP